MGGGATAPLLQQWFTHTGHPAARDPYFLYAASNLGSMLALLAYPLLIEPRVHLRGVGWLSQTWLWRPDSPPTASTELISTWQRNLVALKVERWINWTARSGAVATLTLA